MSLHSSVSDNQKAKFTPYQILVIFLLAILQFTIVLDFMIIAPLGYIITRDLSMTPTQFTSVVSAYAFSAGASGFLTAAFADKFDRKKTLLVFYTGFIVGTLFCGLANSYTTLFWARVMTGIFGGVIGSISTAIVADLFHFNQRGRVMGFIMMAFSVSQVVGLPLGLFIANQMNWEATFIMIVLVSLVIILVVFFKLKPITEHLKLKTDKNPFLHLWHTIANKNYATGFMAVCFMSIGGFMIMPFTTIFTVNNLGIDKDMVPWIFVINGVATMIIMPIMGILSDKINKFVLCSVMSVACGVVVMIYTNLSTISFIHFVLLNILLFTTIMGRIVPMQSLNSAVPAPQDRGAYMSITSSLQQLSGGIGSLLAGLIVVQTSPEQPIQHFDIMGYILAVLFVVALFFVYKMSAIVAQNLQTKKA